MASNTSDQNFTFHKTALRVKDAKASVEFYTDVMGMTLLDKFEVPAEKQILYFLATVPADEAYPHEPGSVAAHKYVLTMTGAVLCLIHYPGTENDADFKYYPGEKEKDGYGHIGFNCSDPVASCAGLEAKGVQFKKKVDEEPMKGMAFALDPDGYCVEVVKRSGKAGITNEFNLSQVPDAIRTTFCRCCAVVGEGVHRWQVNGDATTTQTMLRIANPAKTLPFYEQLGMTCIRQKRTKEFTLYFMHKVSASSPAPADPKSDEATEYAKCLFPPVINFCHVHGTENQPQFKYFVGQEEGRRGFSHLGFLVDDVDAAAEGCAVVRKGNGSVTISDPDGYWVELNRRGGYGDSAAPYE